MRYSNTMRSIILIAHNLRSAHNVGSLLRTAEGLGVEKVYLTGYTPYPQLVNDRRLPHLSLKTDKSIQKTALGAELSQPWETFEDINIVIDTLIALNYTISALEQTTSSITLPEFSPPDKICIIVGREVEGIEPEVLVKVEVAIQIPMFGSKESFNVAQAAAMALYHCRFIH
jgi:23S rRNA (guanosine2251-2'-O)-methyltransferase